MWSHWLRNTRNLSILENSFDFNRDDKGGSQSVTCLWAVTNLFHLKYNVLKRSCVLRVQVNNIFSLFYLVKAVY